jgi:cell division septal protein FtsQ
VSITERVAVATMARPGGVALVDRTGRVLAWEAAAPTDLVRLDAMVTVGRPGSVLPPAAGPGLHVAATLPTALSNRVVAVSVDRRGEVTLDLGNGLSAILGAVHDLSAKFEALASVLLGANPGPGVVDVTVPEEPTWAPPAAAGSGHP